MRYLTCVALLLLPTLSRSDDLSKQIAGLESSIPELSSADLNQMVEAMNNLLSKVQQGRDRSAAMERIRSGMYDTPLREFALALDYETQVEKQRQEQRLVNKAAARIASNKCGCPDCDCENCDCLPRLANSYATRANAVRTQAAPAGCITSGKAGANPTYGCTCPYCENMRLQRGYSSGTISNFRVVVQPSRPLNCRIVNGVQICE